MNMARFLGFIIAGGLWEMYGREKARPYIESGAERLSVIGEELLEGYKGGMAGTMVGSSARAKAPRPVAPKRPARAPAAAPKPKGRPPSQATMDKRRKEAQLEALARGRETRKRNLAAKKAAT